MEKVLVTGSCGFIGMHLCKNLLKKGYTVYGVDNLNDYYDVLLKKGRLENLSKYKDFSFNQIDICDAEGIDSIFRKFNPDKVVNLAAQAGVRYSLVNPKAYVDSNISGFLNILETCKNHQTKGLIYASSSSVYGETNKLPFSTTDKVNKPISIYAVSKRTNELMAYAYSQLYGLRTTALRFFTVYGPWGRPDMAIYKFSKKIIKNEPIKVFNHGIMQRDFTYIDDIVNGIQSSIKKNYPYEIFNLGNNKTVKLMDLIFCIENALKIKAKIKFYDMQKGDVKRTFANIDYSKKMLNFNPSTSIEVGIPKFISWLKEYKNLL